MCTLPSKRGGQHHRKKVVNIAGTGGQDGSEYTAKAKDYLNKSSSKAIDLLTTHIILRNNRKEVLTTFRKKLTEFDDETRKEFETLAPTNDKGLFLNILLPEFH